MPAHNEETLLPACLTALRRAATSVSVPVHLLVAADSCTDRTVAVARACGARVIGVRARSVGAARAAGMRKLLRLTASQDPSAVWLATTDADTVVPPRWLQRHSPTPARAGTSSSARSPSPTGASTRHTYRPPSRPAMPPATGRTPTCTARTSASGPRPTWPPEGSGHCAPPKTTRWSPPRPAPDARSCSRRHHGADIRTPPGPRTRWIQPPAADAGANPVTRRWERPAQPGNRRTHPLRPLPPILPGYFSLTCRISNNQFRDDDTRLPRQPVASRARYRGPPLIHVVHQRAGGGRLLRIGVAGPPGGSPAVCGSSARWCLVRSSFRSARC